VTPVAEYNIWADPEAAKIVFESGMPLTMVGWDISYKYATFDPVQSAELRGIGTELARFCVDIQATLNAFALTKTRLPGYDLPDPIAMAVALEPEVSTRERGFYVEIETTSELCRGQTVVDHLDVMGREPNVRVVQEASREHFLRLLYDAVRPVAVA
jgi:purine nucleosidase